MQRAWAYSPELTSAPEKSGISSLDKFPWGRHPDADGAKGQK